MNWPTPAVIDRDELKVWVKSFSSPSKNGFTLNCDHSGCSYYLPVWPISFLTPATRCETESLCRPKDNKTQEASPNQFKLALSIYQYHCSVVHRNRFTVVVRVGLPEPYFSTYFVHFNLYQSCMSCASYLSSEALRYLPGLLGKELACGLLTCLFFWAHEQWKGEGIWKRSTSGTGNCGIATGGLVLKVSWFPKTLEKGKG